MVVREAAVSIADEEIPALPAAEVYLASLAHEFASCGVLARSGSYMTCGLDDAEWGIGNSDVVGASDRNEVLLLAAAVAKTWLYTDVVVVAFVTPSSNADSSTASAEQSESDRCSLG